MPNINSKNIQGIITHGYGKMTAACFLLVSFDDPLKAKTWLSGLAITNTEEVLGTSCVNIAFTFQGLQNIGLTDETMSKFSIDFQEGMLTEHKRRILGDLDKNAPEYWSWGGPNNKPPIDAILMLYAVNDLELESLYRTQIKQMEAGGVREIKKLGTILLKDRKEHFGFRDGIAQPFIDGLDKGGPPNNTVQAGEFLLGYPNEYGKIPDSPVTPDGTDIGKDGSYLVFRQLSQHVKEYWNFIDQQTKNHKGQSNVDAMIELASKMVGRWPNGEPLVNTNKISGDMMLNLPQAVDAKSLDERLDNFGYHDRDLEGTKCPIGSHIRRTNPRDSLDGGPDESIKVVNRHRIIRRGRAYGQPLDPSMNPSNILNSPDDKMERGLHFICFNANISRQFEFIQHTWVNNPKFGGLYADVDPLMGEKDSAHPDQTSNFTVQGCPARERIVSLPEFVNVQGGAYFFMPGVTALRYLSSGNKGS